MINIPIGKKEERNHNLKKLIFNLATKKKQTINMKIGGSDTKCQKLALQANVGSNRALNDYHPVVFSKVPGVWAILTGLFLKIKHARGSEVS